MWGYRLVARISDFHSEDASSTLAAPTKIFGMIEVQMDARMPKNAIKLVNNGKTVGYIFNIGVEAEIYRVDLGHEGAD